MLSLYIFRFFFISHLWLLLTSTATVNGHHRLCPPSFECGYLGTLYFPFTNTKRPDCGLVAIHGCEEHDPRAAKTIQVNNEPRSFRVTKVEQFPWMIYIKDDDLQEHLNSHNCEAFRNNITLPSSSPLGSFQVDNLKTITLFRCNRNLSVETPPGFNNYSCLDYVILYDASIDIEIPSSLHACSSIQLPVRVSDSQDLFTRIDYEIPVQVRLSPGCLQCYYRLGGQCLLDNQGNFRCVKDNKSWILKLGLGIGLGTAITCTAGLIILRLYKRKNDPSDIQFTSRNTNADRNSNTDPESGSFNFGVPLFSYKELEEATNNFNHSRELGDGGFGTVYYGKLRDGRDVAIKRLYEHNYRRVEQFMNEVDMLTRLRHRNLVSLYGCTSRKSQELLLVYEYIPNGTLASHLHGDLAKLGLLSWPTRMKIAIETASALAYLHASNIIHRDVKTNNILLDNGYWVKVADFGLSRLFPNDVTHVSTTPQGTPGYVDPEYHQCHQLTSKSDVYSFGVVLIELISSMPPVDLTRHKNEINLANFAMKKILKGVFSELVDPVLGFESDNDVKRMVVSVAELAFRCLQGDREFRPSMDEILEALRRIESGRDEPEIVDEEYVSGAGNSHNYLLSPTLTSPDWDEVRLLMNRKPSSSS